MIEASLARQAKVLLLTPTWDNSGLRTRRRSLARPGAPRRADPPPGRRVRGGSGRQLRRVQAYVAAGGDPTDLLSWSNHPNRHGHELVARELMRWFAIL